jgi:hypothetical protein
VQDNSVDFYSDLSMSLLKTVLMMIGEFEASNMTFDHGAYFLFLFFVFIMTIVFMNLLNGLAVSDTQAIKNEAKLVTYKSRVKLLHHFEAVAFGYRVHGRFGYKPLGRFPSFSCVWQEKFLSKISLFPDVFSSGSLDITVDQRTPYTCRNLKKKEKVEFRPDPRFTIDKHRIGFHLDSEVIEAAKDIAVRTARVSEHKTSQIVNRLAKIEEDMQGCKKQLETLEGLLKELINTKRREK